MNKKEPTTLSLSTLTVSDRAYYQEGLTVLLGTVEVEQLSAEQREHLKRVYGLLGWLERGSG